MGRLGLYREMKSDKWRVEPVMEKHLDYILATVKAFKHSLVTLIPTIRIKS